MQALGVDDGRGSLACCSPWGCNELDMIDWPELNLINVEMFRDKTIL